MNFRVPIVQAAGLACSPRGLGTPFLFPHAGASEQLLLSVRIEKRSRELTQALMAGLKKIDGVKIWTSPDPSRSVAVLSFQPGNLDVRTLSLALYQKDRIGCATRGGQDRPGIRLSPHFYNTMADVDRTIATMKKYMSTGV